MTLTFILLKHLHVWCVVLSVMLFCVRLSWLRKQNELLKKRIVRILPHLIDNLMMISGIGMMLILHYHQYLPNWLALKLVLLGSYIMFGLLAMRKKQARLITSSLALLSVFTIVWLAINKPALSFLTF
ncbi:SirB2 family protein [Agaribacterium sp. ZY112]|uniref:SirB2 family protein n=1 Tax=Agaribacterium sp. ZY112 TaxID=3233574 RepID=UPI00352418CD